MSKSKPQVIKPIKGKRLAKIEARLKSFKDAQVAADKAAGVYKKSMYEAALDEISRSMKWRYAMDAKTDLEDRLTKNKNTVGGSKRKIINRSNGLNRVAHDLSNMQSARKVGKSLKYKSALAKMKKMATEDVISELSARVLKSYISKADKHRNDLWDELGTDKAKKTGEAAKKWRKRTAGVTKAHLKVESADINELSDELLKRYVRKAADPKANWVKQAEKDGKLWHKSGVRSKAAAKTIKKLRSRGENVSWKGK